jgi:hypothetical protein
VLNSMPTRGNKSEIKLSLQQKWRFGAKLSKQLKWRLRTWEDQIINHDYRPIFSHLKHAGFVCT